MLDPEIRTAIDDSAHVIEVLSPEALKSARVLPVFRPYGTGKRT